MADPEDPALRPDTRAVPPPQRERPLRDPEAVLSDPLAAQIPHSAGIAWLGSVLMGLGVLAIVFPFLSTLAATVFLGGVFLAAGVLKIADAVITHPFVWRGALKAAWGIVYALAGGWMLYAPLTGAWSLTLVLAVMLVFGGLAAIAWAMQRPRPPASGWMIASGVISIALGVLVALTLPLAAFWFPGVVAGVDLISTGAALLAMQRAQARMARG